MIVAVPVAPVKTLTFPLPSTVTFSLSDCHVTPAGGKFVPVTATDSLTLPPTGSVAVAGVTVHAVTVGASACSSTAFSNGDVENVRHTWNQ